MTKIYHLNVRFNSKTKVTMACRFKTRLRNHLINDDTTGLKLLLHDIGF